MTKEEFIAAMGGEEKMREKGLVAVECACEHECCQGWDAWTGEPQS